MVFPFYFCELNCTLSSLIISLLIAILLVKLILSNFRSQLMFLSCFKTRKASRYLLSCEYKQRGTVEKPLCSNLGANKINAANPKWLLVDVYINIPLSKTGSPRKEFTRMLKGLQVA
jgi:hypothetical protein